MKAANVYLIGAGPGDPGLMTVRGLQLLREADVVIYDRLVNPILLEEAPVNAALVFAGKTSSYHSLPQEQINELLISHARNGSQVVRLKGGDPFVFGRGGEEAEALRAAGIPFEVIPGVSSAVAVPAYAGIPLTHRKLSSSFAVITGHEACKAKASVDWGLLAKSVDTLVVLMGLKSLPRIAANLIEHGRPAETPVALIRAGTTEEQQVIIGTLADIGPQCAKLRPPVLAVVGEVVKLSESLRWFNRSCTSGEWLQEILWPVSANPSAPESTPRSIG
ncbi:MAG: uroporphyrinogen-III C-methyltransferase [Candidatus Binatia bacterium]